MVRGQLSSLNNLHKNELYYRTYSKEYYNSHKTECIEKACLNHIKRGGNGKKATCNIIKQHHESMKDDPEHLTTEFIKKLIKVDCKEIGVD